MNVADTISLLSQALDNESEDPVAPSAELLRQQAGAYGNPRQAVHRQIESTFDKGRLLSLPDDGFVLADCEPAFAAEIPIPVQDRAGRDAVVVCGGRVATQGDLDELPAALAARIERFCVEAGLPAPAELPQLTGRITSRLEEGRASRARAADSPRGTRNRMSGIIRRIPGLRTEI